MLEDRGMHVNLLVMVLSPFIGEARASYQVALPAPAPELLLDVDGDPLDVGDTAGHAGPLVLDMDGEAPLDLLVGDLRGNLHLYLGRTTEHGHRFESAGLLSREGEPIRVHNW